MAPESLTLYLFPMRSQFILAAALMAASPLSRAFAASVDVAPFRLFDRGLNPEAGISYFDHEGNSPFKGEARSKMTFSPDNLHFTFDVKSVDGAYSGWYIAAREKTISFEDKSVLRFEMKGTKNIPTDQFQIGIRTANLPAETNGAKIMLSELGYDRFPTAYTMIEIPVSLLYEREPNLDLKRAVHLLIFGIVEPTKDIVKAEVWIKDARWSWDVQKAAEGYSASLAETMFDVGKAELKPEVHPFLDRVIAVAAGMKGVVVVDGHTDNTGSDGLNEKLSLHRARTVADYLAAGGIARPRLKPTGYGARKPVADNATDVGRDRNRRVDIQIRPN